MAPEPVYFVYVMGAACEPSPQIWYGDRQRGTDKFKHKMVGEPSSQLLYFRKLEGDDHALTLDGLIAKYPFVPNFVYTGRSQ